MKKSLLLAFVISLGSMSSFSQQPANSQKAQKIDKASNNKDELYTKLNLTAGQKTKVEAEYASLKTKKQALENDKSLTKAQKASKLKTYQAEGEKNIAAILTAEQKKKVSSFSKTQKQKFYGHDE
ncbi:hypothetical protein [Parafilimonas sp.]|uniref:hypothetical protein n=1 Tax=Parafilimonas sp. TaxID=1969739 RepID=UPI0039E60325